MKIPEIRIPGISAIILCSALITSLIPSAYASDAVLTWNTNVESDLGGYRVHYGDSPGTYFKSIDVGNQTTYTVTNLNPGIYYFSVTAYDLSGNGSGFSNEVTKEIVGQTDTVPPVISNIKISNLTSTGASISWTTNELAQNQVEYGTTTGYGKTSFFNPTLSTNHSVVIGNLSASTLYHFRLINSDEAGNIAVSDDQVFSTTAGTDSTPPGDVQNFSAIVDNQSILLSWTNPPDTDYKGVRIRFKTTGFPQDINDGILLGDFLGTPGGEGYTVHSNLENQKTYYYSASAFDGSGNFQSTVYASVSINVAAPPSPGNSDQTTSASGGCGMINPNNLGNPPGPGQAADMVGLLILLVMGLIRKTLRKLLIPAWNPEIPTRPVGLRPRTVSSPLTRFMNGVVCMKRIKTVNSEWGSLARVISRVRVWERIKTSATLLLKPESAAGQIPPASVCLVSA